LLYPKIQLKYKSPSLYIYFLFIIFSVILFNYSCTPTKRIEKVDKKYFFGKNENVRVLLTESVKNKIRLKNVSKILDSFGKTIPIKSNSDAQFSFTSIGIKCIVDGNEFFSEEFTVFPKNLFNISFNDKEYRGYFKITANSSSFNLVNYVDIENYSKGVILKEMPLGKGEENFEAIKAFSILVRTYAMKKKLESKELFDLYSDTRDQIYGGVGGESEITNNLVDKTRGQFLFYNKDIVSCFYHSTCGGYTENVENVFKSEPLPYLVSIKDNNPSNCNISPRFNWSEQFSKDLIIRRLVEANYIADKNSKLNSIEIVSRFKSGRVNEMKITLIENKKIKGVSLFSNNIRFVLKNAKGNILPSTNFEITQTSENIKFNGKGFGHGVGLCQWGSIKLSRDGKNFKEILNFYFPKTEIKKLYD